MESPLKRVLDYKLVFDSLCDSNGMVRLETLTARWPTSQGSDPESKVPQGCVRHWTRCANKDGYIDWEGFSTGLQLALSEDTARLTRVNKSDIPRSKAEQRLASLRLKGAAGQGSPPLSQVAATDIESFLSECNREVLMQSLRRMRKEVYRGQLSMHRMTVTAGDSPKKSNDPKSDGKVSRPESGNKTGGIVTKEREELTYGLEMLEKTRKWYKERLKLLATEETKNSKTVTAEELLEVLEKGKSSKNEMLQHLKEINGHLETLSSPAPSLTAEQQSRLQEQIRNWNESRNEKQRSKSEPIGPPPAHVGKAVVEFHTEEQNENQTIMVDASTKPTFPVLTSEEQKMAHNKPTKRSASTTEVNRVGLAASQDRAGGPRQERPHQPRYASSQNISTVSTQPSSSYNQDPRREKARRVPKRSHSFTVSPTRSSKPEPQSEPTSSVTDYPAHKPQQYPLRGTSSMQDLQPGHRTSSSDKLRTMPQGQLSKSSSVRNVSSGHSDPAVTPGLMYQQVYNTGIAYSAQTLPTSRPSDRHRSHRSGEGRSHNPRHARAEHKSTEHYVYKSSSKNPSTQRLGDSIQSLV